MFSKLTVTVDDGPNRTMATISKLTYKYNKSYDSLISLNRLLLPLPQLHGNFKKNKKFM